MTLVARPQNIASVTRALVAQLENWPQVRALGVQVSRSEPLNEDPGSCPWVGVYRDSVEYTSKTLGFGTGYRDANVSLVVAVQQANPKSGQDCEDELEALVTEVAAAILTDVTLGGTVRGITNMKVLYADYRRVGDSFMQTAAVYLTAQVPVTVSDI